MRGKAAALATVFSIVAALLCAQEPHSRARTFENDYMRMRVLPGWTVDTSTPALVKVIHGNYILTIDPTWSHASGIIGGRFMEAIQGMLSAKAVLERVDLDGFTCADPKAKSLFINKNLGLGNLYTDRTQQNIDYGCTFPTDGKPAWFGSYTVGEGSESEFLITVAYNSLDVDALPKKGDPELNRMLRDVAAMLRTLVLKPPILISSIDPAAAPPGATVTIYGSGFGLHDLQPLLTPQTGVPLSATAAPDGKSMSFAVPASKNIISCDTPGDVYINGGCVTAPAGEHYIECPPVNDRHPTFCGVEIPPGTYQVQVFGSQVHSNKIALTVTAPKSRSVEISLLYPNSGVLPGDTIRVSGSGFTTTSNTVTIGNAVVSNVPSPDGRSLSFEAPQPEGTSSHSGYYEARISNANGESNTITFAFSGQH